MRLSDIPIRPIDHLPMMGAPSASALDGRIGRVNYAELETTVGRLATWLANFGFEPGSRIASWMAKSLPAAILPLATVRAGLVHVPINPLLKHGQVAHILNDSGASLLIGGRARLESLTNDDIPSDCLIRDEGDAAAAMTGGSALPCSESSCDDLAAILYTSGSTGRPKGVMLSHANLWLGAVSVMEYLHLTAEDRVLALLPFSFDYGQNQLFSTWAAGGCAIPLDYLTPRDVVKAVDRYQANTLAGVPPLWVQIVEQSWPDEVARKFRRLTNSGGSLNRTLIDRLRTLFPQADLYPMYGLTEAFRSTFLPPHLVAAHPDSIGRPIPHAEILVCRPDGSVTDDDEPGELVHCGPLVAQGYWRDTARTAERFRPAPAASRYGGIAVWSGDTVRRDSEGLLYFVGRNDAMIKVSGNRISPTEVEEVALAVSGIAEAVALGVPDARTGQAVHLLVRLTDNCDRDETLEMLDARLRQELPGFMVPAQIDCVAAFPCNPNGKIDRDALIRSAGEVEA